MKGPADSRQCSWATLLLWRSSHSTDRNRKQPDVWLCLPLGEPHREGRSEFPYVGIAPTLPCTTHSYVISLPTVSSSSVSAFTHTLYPMTNNSTSIWTSPVSIRVASATGNTSSTSQTIQQVQNSTFRTADFRYDRQHRPFTLVCK